MANGATVCRLPRGVLYFQNVTRFYGTQANVISFMPLRKKRRPYAGCDVTHKHSTAVRADVLVLNLVHSLTPFCTLCLPLCEIHWTYSCLTTLSARNPEPISTKVRQDDLLGDAHAGRREEIFTWGVFYFVKGAQRRKSARNNKRWTFYCDATESLMAYRQNVIRAVFAHNLRHCRLATCFVLSKLNIVVTFNSESRAAQV
jgi:hypothetical protein